MKKGFNLTEGEKKYIRSRYNLVTESVDPRVVEELEKYRSLWKGCGGFYVDLRQFGTLNEMPEFGFAIFEGDIDGYNVKVNGCFDKYKLIYTDGGESGERGDFKGYYYSEIPRNTTPRYFKGDESKGNQFMYGTLTKSKEFFVNLPEDWAYQGEFIDGVVEGQGQVYSASMGMGYNGAFSNGNIQGKGVMTFIKTGLILNGDFKQTPLGVISATLDDGKTVDNVIEYNKTKSGNKTEVNKTKVRPDLSLGIKKGGNVIGTTYYESTIEFNGTTKEFSGILPKTFIRIISKENNKTFFETFSDNQGAFSFDDVIYGKYTLFAFYGNKDNTVSGGDAYTFKIDELEVNGPSTKVSLTLIPNKFLKGSEKTTIKLDEILDSDDINFSDKKYNNLWYYNTFVLSFKNSEYEKKINDLLSGRLEQMKGNLSAKEFCTNQFVDYGKDLVKLHQDELKREILKTREQLGPTKKSLEYCWSKFKNDKDFRRSIGKESILLIRNPNGRLLDYQLNLEQLNVEYIYNKKLMGLSTIIKKVVLEHNEKKSQNLSESLIVNNRFNFILDNFDTSKKFNKKLLENYLQNEKESLVVGGYNRHLVSNIFNKIITKLKN
jgi:hypothetical protein